MNNQELYEPTIGHYEAEFRKHNERQKKLPLVELHKLYALPFGTAVDLVNNGMWDRLKSRYMVILKI